MNLLADDREPPHVYIGSNSSENSPVPFGSSRSSSPIPTASPIRLGATSQEGTREEMETRDKTQTWNKAEVDDEYTWSASLKDQVLNIPDLTMLSTKPETSFKKWNLNLLRTLVGKAPFLIDYDGESLINTAKTPLERRGNRMLYSEIWSKVVEKAQTDAQAKQFENLSSAKLGDGVGLVEELRIFCSYGDEEQNVAAAQLNKLTLTACDHATVDKFLNDLDDGWGRAGSLVNDVTVLGLIEEQFGIDGEGQQAKRLG